jgi:hypothetical protein
VGGPRRWLWTVLLLLPAVGGTDEVHLTNGGVVRGVIVERTDGAVVIETGPGRVTLPLSRVSRVVDGASALATFQERAAQIGFDDVEGLADLARWAGDHALATYSRHTWERVLALDPGHPEANAALGRTHVDGVWMSEQDAYRAQGDVRFEGQWVTPAEHEALLREQSERELVASDRREAELRVREAEARAREAEARAREAETYANQAEEPVNGIPYWWVLAGGGGEVWPPGGHFPRPPATLPEEPVHPIYPAQPPMRTRPGQSIWRTPPASRPPVAKPHGGSPQRSSSPRSGSKGSSIRN